MENGVYRVRKTNEGITGCFIDEESGELNDMNRKVSARLRQAEWEATRRREEIARTEKRREAANRREHQAAVRLVKQVTKLMGVAALVFAGHKAELVELEFMLPVLLCILAVICFRAGKHYGRKRTKRM